MQDISDDFTCNETLAEFEYSLDIGLSKWFLINKGILITPMCLRQCEVFFKCM